MLMLVPVSPFAADPVEFSPPAPPMPPVDSPAVTWPLPPLDPEGPDPPSTAVEALLPPMPPLPPLVPAQAEIPPPPPPAATRAVERSLPSQVALRQTPEAPPPAGGGAVRAHQRPAGAGPTALAPTGRPPDRAGPGPFGPLAPVQPVVAEITSPAAAGKVAVTAPPSPPSPELPELPWAPASPPPPPTATTSMAIVPAGATVESITPHNVSGVHWVAAPAGVVPARAVAARRPPTRVDEAPSTDSRRGRAGMDDLRIVADARGGRHLNGGGNVAMLTHRAPSS
ncbi:MAG: hypothetical protein R2704_12760 [Microthrixaceae bacterium]